MTITLDLPPEAEARLMAQARSCGLSLDDFLQTIITAPSSFPGLETEFRTLVDKWRKDTLHSSSLTKMVTHPLYLRIIGLGHAALPLLLNELRERPDHWLVALNAITGEDPAPPGSSFDQAVDAWLKWGHERGYLK